MTSRHLVDPELLPALELFPPINLSMDTLPMVRAAFQEQAATSFEDKPLATTEAIIVPGSSNAPPIRVMMSRPASVTSLLPALLHIHGGGYVIGDAEMMGPMLRELAAELGCAVFSVDYRLAPETVFPGGIEDCYTALKWLTENAETLRIDSTRIGVMGESAGGGLAAALALLVRDRGELSLMFQHLIYPMIDDRTGITSEPHPFTGEFVWTPEHSRFGWGALLGTAPGGPGVSPYAAAARATDLAFLPPAFIAVGALDLFLDEDLDYARRLARAGVPVELHVYPGAFHGFHMAPDAKVTKAANRDSKEALRRAFAG